MEPPAEPLEYMCPYSQAHGPAHRRLRGKHTVCYTLRGLPGRGSLIRQENGGQEPLHSPVEKSLLRMLRTPTSELWRL